MVLKMETINPRICSFYKENPNINFETINLLFIDLFENMLLNINSDIKTTINTQILSNINENSVIINDLKDSVSTLKNAVTDYNNESINTLESNNNKIISEIGDLIFKSIANSRPSSPVSNNLFTVTLNKLFSTSEILQLKEYDSSMVYLMKRYQKPKILIETKDCDFNILTDDINHFVKIVEERNSHGIFISQNSGISTKPNYHIDYNRGNIIVYIHNCEYSHEKIKIAIDIIDNLAIKLKELNNVNDDNTIPKAILDDINKEYQLFISQKEALISVYKDCQKKVLSQMDEIRFPCLDKYLSTKYTNQVQKQGFKCDLCKCFNANNLKALAAHKRGCARKNVFIVNSSVQA